MQQAGVSTSACTVKQRLLEDGLFSSRAEKLPQKHQGQTGLFSVWGIQKHDCTVKEKVECYHQSCIMPTVKHPGTIHVWGCFPSKRVNSQFCHEEHSLKIKNGTKTPSESNFSQPSKQLPSPLRCPVSSSATSPQPGFLMHSISTAAGVLSGLLADSVASSIDAGLFQ